MRNWPPWNQTQFEQYVTIALHAMARGGVVAVDPSGQPSYRPQPTTRTVEGSLRIEMTAVLSAMGLSSTVPVSATTQANGSVTWMLNCVPIRTIPAEWTPEEAGEGLSENLLRAVHCRSEEIGQAGGRGR